MRQELKDRLKKVTDWAAGKKSSSSEPAWREIGPPRLGKELADEILSEAEQAEDRSSLRKTVADRLHNFRKAMISVPPGITYDRPSKGWLYKGEFVAKPSSEGGTTVWHYYDPRIGNLPQLVPDQKNAPEIQCPICAQKPGAGGIDSNATARLCTECKAELEERGGPFPTPSQEKVPERSTISPVSSRQQVDPEKKISPSQALWFIDESLKELDKYLPDATREARHHKARSRDRLKAVIDKIKPRMTEIAKSVPEGAEIAELLGQVGGGGAYLKDLIPLVKVMKNIAPPTGGPSLWDNARKWYETQEMLYKPYKEDLQT